MRVRPVDERDAKVETTACVFRVVLVGEGRLAAFDLDDADLREVIEWAEGNRGADRYAVAARSDRAEAGIELIWLTGSPDPYP